MSIESDINWIISELTKVKDPELVNALKSMLKYSINQNEQPYELSSEEERELSIAREEAAKGDYLSHDEVMKNPRKWG